MKNNMPIFAKKNSVTVHVVVALNLVLKQKPSTYSIVRFVSIESYFILTGFESADPN